MKGDVSVKIQMLYRKKNPTNRKGQLMIRVTLEYIKSCEIKEVSYIM